MNCIKSRIFMSLAALLTAAAAHADIRDQMDIQTGKAELVMPGMAAERVAALVKDGLSQWAIPANSNVRSMPSSISARPDEPTIKQIFVAGGAPAIEYQCQTAYAEITKRPPPVKNAFMYAAEMTQACVYPFQKGVKVYLIFTSLKKTESLTSGLFNGITRAIRGEDDEWMNKQLMDSIAAIRKNIPTVLVEKLEVPGRPVLEPDKELVAALIPAKSTVMPVVALPVPRPVAQVEVSPPNSSHAKIEARKSLTGMGMTYHSHEQFIAAIQRKDDVAVETFLAADGVDLAIKDKNGKTPLELARNIGAASIARMISEQINPPAAGEPADVKFSPSASPAPAAAVQPSAQADSPPSLAEYEAAKATLPASEVEKILASIDTQNLSPEQKELFKRRGIILFVKMKAQAQALGDRIDPVSGSLR